MITILGQFGRYDIVESNGTYDVEVTYWMEHATEPSKYFIADSLESLAEAQYCIKKREEMLFNGDSVML